MTQASDKIDEEALLLSTIDAEKLARDCRGNDDPHAESIPHSLLSADHIEKYVLTTGMIAPFHKGGDRNRLKKASYEGRIGNKAYEFDKNDNLISVYNPSEPLRVAANSILFVEIDLDFRLPDYIGVRFNLQIRHVHRGLLLGTGPLVDPGYWGKLCVPLHNLTNADYIIPLNEGLIWVEFTKTTSKPVEGGDALARDGSEHWDIEKFIRKAARRIEGGPSIGIRSSIPAMVLDANARADEASKSANEALGASTSAAADAKTAQKHAEDSKNTINRIGYLAAALIGLTIFGLYLTIFFGWRADINSVQEGLTANASAVGEIKGAAVAAAAEVQLSKQTVEELLTRVSTLENEISTLRVMIRENQELPPNEAVPVPVPRN